MKRHAYQSSGRPTFDCNCTVCDGKQRDAIHNIPLEWDALFSKMDEEPSLWVSTTEAMYYEMLGVLPPQDMGKGAFLVGEPTRHNAKNQAVYACFNQSGEAFQARYMTQSEFTQFKAA